MVNQRGQIVMLFLVVIICVAAANFIPYVLASEQSLPVKLAGMLLPLFFLIAFLNTNFALIILVFSMLLSPEFSLGSAGGRAVVIRLDDILISIIFLGWMMKMALHKELGLTRVSSLNRPIGAYLIVCLLSTAWGMVTGLCNPKQSVFYLLKYLEYFMVFFMVSNNLESTEQIKRFTIYLVITGVAVSVYSLYGHFIQGTRASAPFEGKEGEPNTLAGYLLIIMSILLGLMLYSKSPQVFCATLVFFFLSFTSFLYTLSRSGWLSFIPVCLVFLLLTKRKRAVMVVLLLVAVFAGAVLAPKIVKQRVRETFVGKTVRVMGHTIKIDESTIARLESAKASMKMWREHPIIGRGVPGGGTVSDVQYTRILREVGVIGFGAFLWIIATIFKLAYQTYRSPLSSDFAQALSLALIAALAGLLTMAWGAEVFIIIRVMEPFWFLTALVVTLAGTYGRREEDRQIADVQPA